MKKRIPTLVDDDSRLQKLRRYAVMIVICTIPYAKLPLKTPSLCKFPIHLHPKRHIHASLYVNHISFSHSYARDITLVRRTRKLKLDRQLLRRCLILRVVSFFLRANGSPSMSSPMNSPSTSSLIGSPSIVSSSSMYSSKKLGS